MFCVLVNCISTCERTKWGGGGFRRRRHLLAEAAAANDNQKEYRQLDSPSLIIEAIRSGSKVECEKSC